MQRQITASFQLLISNHIRKGEAEIMVAGGTEVAVMPTGVAGF